MTREEFDTCAAHELLPVKSRRSLPKRYRALDNWFEFLYKGRSMDRAGPFRLTISALIEQKREWSRLIAGKA